LITLRCLSVAFGMIVAVVFLFSAVVSLIRPGPVSSPRAFAKQSSLRSNLLIWPCQPRGTDARQTNAWRHSCAQEEGAQSAFHLTACLFKPPNRKESHKNRFGRAPSHPSSR